MARRKRRASVRQSVEAEIKRHAAKDTPDWPEHQLRAKSEDQSFTHPPTAKAVHPHIAKSMAMAPSGLRDAMVGRTRTRRRKRG